VIAKRGALDTTVVVCAAGALLAAAGGLAIGSWRGGAALALGLLVGSVNGLLARRSLGLDASFRMTSMGRLAVLSVVGMGLGVLLGLPYVPLVLIGVGAAQLVLAIVSAMAVVRA
jgi:hypothetical protein